MDLALRLGTSRFYSALRNFGMGQKTGVDFTGESSGIMMKEDNVKTVDLARIGFGQAVAVTPLQLITGVCSVINGGTLYKPYLVASVDSYDGKNLATREPQPVRRTVSEATSQKMRDYLVGRRRERRRKQSGRCRLLCRRQNGHGAKVCGRHDSAGQIHFVV